MPGRRFLASPVLWVGLFLAALMLRMDALQPLLQRAFPGVQPVVYNRDSFFTLFLSQLGLVAAASLGASLVGVALAIFVTRPAGRDFRAMVNAIGSTVGALTLGTPIFDGLVANKIPFVLEGAVLVALFAILTDLLFARLEG